MESRLIPPPAQMESYFMFCGRTLSTKPIHSRLWLLGVVVWYATLWCHAKPVCAQDVAVESAKPATGEQTARWIAQLDDDRYATRENAQFRLEQAGSAAVAEVARKALTGSLESSTRALNILLSWSESSDPTLRIAALEQIVALPHRPTESELAGQILADAREEAALAKIVELGGLHTSDPQLVGARLFNLDGRLVQPVKVIIGTHWKGGLEGLKYLHQIPRATVLSLHSSPLGDEVIPVLLDLPQVKKIELYGAKLSDDASKELQEKISPNVILDVRSGALLGVGGVPRAGRAQVGSVVVGSAAEKAGLQPGDLITELDGEKVVDFVALIDRIKVHEPGDTVTLKITRMDRTRKKMEQLDIQVTFDRWGTDSTKPPTFTQPAAQQNHAVVPKKISFGRR